MRPVLPVLAVVAALVTLVLPVHAATQPRAGLSEGLHLGAGFTGLSLDWSLGPLSIGGAVAGSASTYGELGGNLDPSLRAVWTVRQTDSLAIGLVAGASENLYTVYSNYSAPPVRTRPLVGDVGLAVSYQFDFPDFFGRTVPLTISPTVTLMLDGNQTVAFGPHSGLELAWRVAPGMELTVGGGTFVGVRSAL